MRLTPLEEPATSLKFSQASECQSRQMVQERGKKISMHKQFFLSEDPCRFVITFLAQISKISKLLVQRFCFPIKEITAFEPYLVLLLGVLKETDISVLF